MPHTTGPVMLPVGYYDPFSIFNNSSLRKDFEKRVNTINALHWKSGPNDSMKSVRNIRLEFIEEIPNKISEDLFESFYVRFMFVTITNVEDYRTKVRPLIQHWVHELKNNKKSSNSAYFIILFENTELRSAADKYLRTNILAKTKKNFSDDSLTYENIFKIKSLYESEEDKNVAWNSIINSVKSVLADSISFKIDHYLSNTKSLESLLSAASLYAQMGQADDAMKCYSKLSEKISSIDYESGFKDATVQDYPLLKRPAHLDLKLSPSKFQLKCFFYKRQVDILLKQATSEISYLRVLVNVSKKLIDFLNSIQESYKKSEMVYIMVQDFIQNDKLQYMLSKTETNLTELFEVLGDLKLLKRNEIIRLGKLNNYKIKGSMIDVSLDDDKTPEHNLNYEVISDGLKDLLESEEHFLIEIIDQSKDIIKCYSTSQFKQNTVDSLSTELALMTCYNLDLTTSTTSTTNQTALEALNTSFEYYRSQNWKYISLSILQVYIDNLEHFIETYGSSIIPDLMCSYLELVSHNQYFDKAKFIGLLDKVNHVMKNDHDGLMVENDALFDVNVQPFLKNGSVDKYKLSLTLKSKIGYHVDNISLILINSDEQTISFSKKDFNLDKFNEIEVMSTELITGDFQIVRMIVEIGQLKIFKALDFPISIYQSKRFYDDDLQLIQNTFIDASIPRTRNLHQDEVLISADIGSKALDNCRLLFYKTEIDRLVTKSKYSICLNGLPLTYKLVNNDEFLRFDIKESLPADSKIELKVPYFFPPDVASTKLNLKFGISFNNNAYSKTVYKELDIVLPIAVSVQDIFKSSDLFSNFTINGTTTGKPIRIQKVNLESKHSIVKAWNQPHNVIAYSDQGSTFFYKIEKIEDPALELIIDYNDIKVEIVQVLKKLFFNELNSNNKHLIKYFDIVESIFSQLEFKCNYYSLKSKIIIVGFSLADYTKYLQLIFPSDLPNFIRSITNFLTSQPFTVTEQIKKESLEEIRQTLLINVTLPVINTINTIEFKFQKKLQYLVCDPIEVQVNLSVMVFKMPVNHTKKVRFMGEPELPSTVLIKLEFIENEQNWLLAGLKDFTIPLTLKDTKSNFDFNIVMIPLRAGKLELPKVAVRNLTGGFKLQMELDYKNSSESLLVVSELNKVLYSF